MGFGLVEILVLAVIAACAFGVGRLPDVLGDLGRAVGGFRNRMREKESAADPAPVLAIEGPRPVPAGARAGATGKGGAADV